MGTTPNSGDFPKDVSLIGHDEASKIEWDAVVIGTGMGGGTLGYELARRGRRVLFLEKGMSSLPGTDSIAGQFPEETFDIARLTDDEVSDRMAHGGRNIEWFLDATPGPKPKAFRALLGCGTGGSSALYGMVTERFFREDFAPRSHFPDAGESTLPDVWPIPYDELLPWYRSAERLYRVRGSADPLRPNDDTETLITPRPMTSANAEVAQFLRNRGLHPYTLHIACEDKPECRACQSYLCAAGCKNHSGNICVEPAVASHGAELLDRTRVVRLEASRTQVTSVVAERNGEEFTVRGRQVIVAAGALMTPVLLLQSRSAKWPNGLANDHDVVGRNFMRHFVDLYVFHIRHPEPVTGQIKEISANDFYLRDGEKYGTIQSMGHVPPYEFIMNSDRTARKLFGFLRPLVGRRWKSWLQDRFIVLAAIAEDLPYWENRILPGPGNGHSKGPSVELQYTMQPTVKARHARFARSLKKTLGKYPGSRISPMYFSAASANSALGHQCGTCRFGIDPKTSVVRGDCRAWELDNLYVVDTSILPSSAGINPSLTIAANALRVAEVIDQSL